MSEKRVPHFVKRAHLYAIGPKHPILSKTSKSQISLTLILEFFLIFGSSFYCNFASFSHTPFILGKKEMTEIGLKFILMWMLIQGKYI